MGYSGAQFDPEKVDLFFESAAGSMQDHQGWRGTGLQRGRQQDPFRAEVTAIADVKMGNASATAWGCDLTFDYVKINADYRS